MSLFADYARERLGAESIETEHGFLTFSLTPGSHCFLRDIYVKPNFRAVDVGRKMVEQMEELARQADCKTVTATIYLGAKGATEALHAALHIGMKLHSVGPDFVGLIKEL